jgi:non-canonical purine NTP pyrophosphatase (RdgB/HAM1 family)
VEELENFLFVTSSDEKAREAEEILGRRVERVSLDLPEVQAASAAAIALQKARDAFGRLGKPCVAEDSALEFSAWHGMPGPFVKWFQKQAGLEALCRSLDAFHDRRAVALCALAFRSETEEVVVEGRCGGSIALQPTGSSGFGWDSIFVPEGQARTFGEMSGGEKNAISHRRKAWEELRRRVSRRGL